MLMAVIAFSTCLGMKAQNVITNNYDSPISSVNETKDNSNSFVKGTDFMASYSSKTKILGLTFNNDFNKYLYMGLSVNADIDGFDIYATFFNLGLSKRYQIGNNLLVQGKIGPYIGYGSVYEDDKFYYGANGSVSFGVKLWDTKKGNSTFITLGYYIDAYEFETTDLIKNGSWGIGFTTILN